MDCAFCNQTMEGCACIRCSQCSSHFHLECVSGEQLSPSSNSWRCCRCETQVSAHDAQAVEAPIHA